MASFASRGDWAKTFKFLGKTSHMDWLQSKILERYAKEGMNALKTATPRRTGLTAASWSYEIEKTGTGWIIHWKNSNENRGIYIAFILQAGHGTGTGGYVQGIDYINPALAPVFKSLADAAFQEVTSI